MTFIFDRKQFTAVDLQNEARIKHSRARRNILGLVSLIYEGRELSFEFYIYPIYRYAKIESEGDGKEKSIEVAVYIDLQSVQSGINLALRKKGRPPLSDAERSQYLNQVREGTFAFVTRGGQVLEKSPDYRVDFVQSQKDLATALRSGEVPMGPRPRGQQS